MNKNTIRLQEYLNTYLAKKIFEILIEYEENKDELV